MNIGHIISRFLGRGGPGQPMPDDVVPMMQGQPGQNYMAGPMDPMTQQYNDPLAPLPGQEASVEVGALPRGIKAARLPGQQGGGLRGRMQRNAGPGAQNFMGGKNAMTFNVPKNVSGGIRKLFR